MSKDHHPENWSGTREVIHIKHPCGFCMVDDHRLCRHELPWYDKLWICGCQCNKDWKPLDVFVERKTNKAV